MHSDNVKSAELVLPCRSLGDTLNYFVDQLEFRVESIYPADAPRVAVVSGYGIKLRLDESADGPPQSINLRCNDVPDGPTTQTAPNGTKIHFVPANESMKLPSLTSSLVVEKLGDTNAFGVGRAGMQYRDLIPDRYGGRFIASHIRIPDGGPVPDYVHHHHVQFQFIFCVHGWVKVVYEDQGPPIMMRAGDCFLQPPHIRHRVLESSAQMEVVEMACPAEHETCVDHDMTLPTNRVNPNRLFGDQRFVYHDAKKAPWNQSSVEGLERQESEIAVATNGIVAVNVLRATSPVAEVPLQHDGDLRFLFILCGNAHFSAQEDKNWLLGRGDACAIPRSVSCRLTNLSDDFSYLEVQVPIDS